MADCLRCKSHDACVPKEIELRQLVTGVEDLDEHEFVPVPSTMEQFRAADEFAVALSRMIRAYGLEATASKLKDSLSILRASAKLHRIDKRILAARSTINARARASLEVHDDASAVRIYAESTPDYPGRAADDAWLRENAGYGIE